MQYKIIGGNSKDLAFKKNKSGETQLYCGPEWLNSGGWGSNFGIVKKG